MSAGNDPVKWRTRLDPNYTGGFGYEELHVVLFEPDGDQAGARMTTAITIPEVPRTTIRKALREATQHRARVVFLCDTREQADFIADWAAQRLPHHHRISYERAEAGQWGMLT